MLKIMDNVPVVQWYSVKKMKTNFGFLVIDATSACHNLPIKDTVPDEFYCT